MVYGKVIIIFVVYRTPKKKKNYKCVKFCVRYVFSIFRQWIFRVNAMQNWIKSNIWTEKQEHRDRQTKFIHTNMDRYQPPRCKFTSSPIYTAKRKNLSGHTRNKFRLLLAFVECSQSTLVKCLCEFVFLTCDVNNGIYVNDFGRSTSTQLV